MKEECKKLTATRYFMVGAIIVSLISGMFAALKKFGTT